VAGDRVKFLLDSIGSSCQEAEVGREWKEIRRD
jgi:hypothetical protein